MREDIAKKLCERPRRGNDHGHNHRKHRRKSKRQDEDRLDALPRKESMGRPHYYERKSLSENFAPVLRFLQKRVGRPWNKVHSEISEHVDYNSATMKHIADHVFRDFVYLHPVFDEVGKPYRSDYSFRYYLRPGEFYVDPKGFLREAPRISRKTHRRYTERRDPHMRINDLQEYRKINGIWHWVRYQHVRKDSPAVLDVILREHFPPLGGIVSHYTNERACVASNGYPVHNGERVLTSYAAPVYRVCVEKRQISKKAIRQLGLNKL